MQKQDIEICKMEGARFDYREVPPWRKSGKQSVFSKFVKELEDNNNTLDPKMLIFFSALPNSEAGRAFHRLHVDNLRKENILFMRRTAQTEESGRQELQNIASFIDSQRLTYLT